MTLVPTRLQALRNALAAHPAVESVMVEATAGTLRVRARSTLRSWDLRLKPERLSQWPEFYLLDEPLIGRLAHVNHTGIVCVTDKVGLSIDPINAGAVVSAALTDALVQLDKSLTDERAGEFSALLDEFEGYWLSLPGHRTVDVHLAVDEQLRPVTAVLLAKTPSCVAFTERHIEKHPAYAGLRRYQSMPRTQALYIPLVKAFLPPSPTRSLSAEMVRAWVTDGLDPASRPELEKWLRSWSRVTSAYLLFSQPKPGGGRAVFGIEFQTKRSIKHPLLVEGASWSLRPLQGKRHTAEVLRPRGGASSSLANKHMAVVGCGAVGSRVAELLVLSGVGELTLVDPEVLDPDNLFRHVLGGESCGVYKARALAEALVRRLPEVKCNPVMETLEEWANHLPPSLDGVVLALGAPHLERAFVRASRHLENFKMPIVTTWLEAVGLGGHAQLSKAGAAGCLECLYTHIDGTSSQVPKIAYVKPGQTVSRTLTSCVGSFTSFSALDATQTAILATRLMVRELAEEECASYDAWKGSDREAKAAGIRTTPWYQGLDNAAVAKAATEYSRVPCGVCGGTT